MDNYEWDKVLAIFLALHGLAIAIVNLTPTPKDDEFLKKIYKPIEMLAGIISSKAKQK